DAPLGYVEYVGPLPHDIQFPSTGEVDFIHLFANYQSSIISHYPSMLDRLSTSGLMWISWPKRSAKTDSDLSRDWIREYLLERGLVDVKVASYNDIWSALKFVYRAEDR
ncbi:MAG: DUF3052 domain-containing protein, partial [Bacteroidota bacterium]